MAGCSAIREIQDNAQAIFTGVVDSASNSQLPEKIVTAVVAPSVITITEALLATVAVFTGGLAGYAGVKRGVKLNGNG